MFKFRNKSDKAMLERISEFMKLEKTMSNTNELLPNNIPTINKEF